MPKYIPILSSVFLVVYIIVMTFVQIHIYQHNMNNRIEQMQKKLKTEQTLNQQLKKDNANLEQKNTKLEDQFDSLQKSLDEAVKLLNSKSKIVQDSQIVPKQQKETLQQKTVTVTATAYTAYCKGCSGITAWGNYNLRAHPDLKVIAVDPNVIPLGSKVYVEGYGYAIAADTGSAIKNNRIDLFMPSRADALQWGRKTVKVSIISN